MGKSLFITGTDTGVGKTTVSIALAKILLSRGLSVAYFKPVETGCFPECQDGSSLSEITGQSLDEVVLYKFKEPVAPLVAEEINDVKIEVEKIYSHYERLLSRYDFVIVEGAGGIKVPITENNGYIFTYLDMVYELDLPVLIVSRAGLGTINHTVLTIDALNSVESNIIGIVLNQFTGKEISEPYNPEVIEKMTGVKVLAICHQSKFPEIECFKKLGNIYLT